MTISFKRLNPEDWQAIQCIANVTWPNTFGTLMSRVQINYMLQIMYSESSLKAQMLASEHQFLGIEQEGLLIGFSSYGLNCENSKAMMIHKFYLLPECQRKGVGTLFMEHLSKLAISAGCSELRLKVFYKNNKAIHFYTKVGFEKKGEIQTDIGNGFLILDDVMERKL